MCGGFTCTKNALQFLNFFYLVVAFLFLSTAIYSQTTGLVMDQSMVRGFAITGLVLLVISAVGLLGTAKHHQVILFCYMLTLFLLFVAQFSVACASLATNSEQRRHLAQKSWNSSSMEDREQKQVLLDCCGFDLEDAKSNILCPNVPCCQFGNCSECASCQSKLQDSIDIKLNISGFIGLLFSLTELLGVWLTIRYRNQKNPRANLNAFL